MRQHINVQHRSEDRFEIDIRGHRITVDQPQESVDQEAGPTPTELFVAALASCTAHYAQKVLAREDAGASVSVDCDFEMSEGPPWRVAHIALDVHLPATISDQRRAGIQRAIQHCTVHESLRRPPHVGFAFDGQPALVPGVTAVNADAAAILSSG